MEAGQKSDRQIIEAALDDYVTHWNNNDMDSWGNLFTDDVDYINRKGGWWKNNKDNIDGHKQIHKMLMETGQPKTFGLKVGKIEFLKPDVAVVQALSTWPGFKPLGSGDETYTLKGILTCIFVKTKEKWLIKTLHNTLRD
ncbi:SgcJ/EcaC family oxidoreductase [Sinomicrobium sp. M5D2P9]